MKQKAGIRADEKVRLEPYPPKRNWFEQYLMSTSETVVDAKLKELFGNLSYKLWMQGGILRLMPYTIEVK